MMSDVGNRILLVYSTTWTMKSEDFISEHYLIKIECLIFCTLNVRENLGEREMKIPFEYYISIM